MKRLQSYLPALAIFFLALFVRVVYNLTVAQGYAPLYDAGYYNTLALHLAYNHCFCFVPHSATTSRAPLWPAVMAGIYLLLGPQNIYARLFLCLVGSGTCVLVYLFAKDIFGRRIALVAGILAAVYTGLYIYDGWLYSESLYTFLLTGFAYTLYLVQRTTRVRWMIISGLAVGLMSLTRPNGLLYLGLLVIWAIIIGKTTMISWRAVAKSVLVVMLVALVLVAPWTYRNYRLTHAFIPVAIGSGVVLAGAYNDTILVSVHDRGMWVPPGAIRPLVIHPHGGCCDLRGEADDNAYVVNWVRNHTSEMPYLLSLHFVNMWKPYTPDAGLPVIQFPERISSQFVWNMMQFMPIAIFILAAFGLLVTWRRWLHLMIIYLVILLTIAQCLFYYGSARFRAPIEPLLVIVAAGVIWWLTQSDYGTLRWMLERRDKTLAKTADEPVEQEASWAGQA
jgi:4-amino-4-deoxy-L-arabinose transferase-like glycosyltransferase